MRCVLRAATVAVISMAWLGQSIVTVQAENTPDSPAEIEVVRLSRASASEGTGFQSVPCLRMKSGEVEILRAGTPAPLLRPLRLPNDVQIHPDGTLTLLRNDESLGKLAEGERLFMDGSLMRTDGSVTYPQDHYVRVRGKILRVTRGIAEPVANGVTLENGAWMHDHDLLTMPNGFATRIQDGQIFQPDGKELHAWDTISYRDGHVVLFKDGSLIPLEAGRTMIMNDGTSVRGDGRVLRHHATRAYTAEPSVQLSDGDLLRVVRVPGPRNTNRQTRGY